MPRGVCPLGKLTKHMRRRVKSPSGRTSQNRIHSPHPKFLNLLDSTTTAAIRPVNMAWERQH